MYLRHTKRKTKDGEHTYWMLVRSVRHGSKVRQEVVAHLGRLDDEKRLQATDIARHFLGARASQPELFEDQRELKPATVDVGKVRVERPRAFGDVWLGHLLWRALGLDDNVARQVELGGHVHDIGKIGVREAILNKPGPLTDEEYEHIMLHPMVGWRILSPLLQDAPLALNIVRSHHERFDGRGIPDGLAGTAIPIEARIAAVADAFDAMTSGRPYRAERRYSVDAALAELRRCRGTQFDPLVVDAFLGAVDEGMLAIPDFDLSEPPAGSA